MEVRTTAATVTSTIYSSHRNPGSFRGNLRVGTWLRDLEPYTLNRQSASSVLDDAAEAVAGMKGSVWGCRQDGDKDRLAALQTLIVR